MVSKTWMFKVGIKANQGGTAGSTRPCIGTGIYIFIIMRR